MMQAIKDHPRAWGLLLGIVLHELMMAVWRIL